MKQSTLDKETRKAINFDFDEAELKRRYPSRFPFAYKRAWSVVKKFMVQHGFEHRQYSGYVSKDPMSYFELNKVLIELRNTHPWVGPCSRQFDVTEVGDTYSVLDVLRGRAEKVKEHILHQSGHGEHGGRREEAGGRIRDLDMQIKDMTELVEQERKRGTRDNVHGEPER